MEEAFLPPFLLRLSLKIPGESVASMNVSVVSVETQPRCIYSMYPRNAVGVALEVKGGKMDCLTLVPVRNEMYVLVHRSDDTS